MGAAAVLAQDSLAVEPGGQVTTRVRVRNTGEVVDQYTFEVLGPAAAWASFDPPSLSLFPDADGVAEVRFAPPRESTTRTGTLPFGLRITSQEDPEGSVVTEGDLVVGRYEEVYAELVPRTTRGRSRGRHDLAVTNRGNAPLRGRLVGVDPDRHVSFAFTPPEVQARPGGAAFATVDVRPRKRFLRGPSVTLPYKVRLEAVEQEPIDVDGAFLQEALIPKWVPKALLALAALIAAWLVFLKPTVQTAAKDAVTEQVNEASQLAASQAVAPALAAADERLANVEAAVGITPGAPLPGPTTTTSTIPTLLEQGDPFDARLQATENDQRPALEVGDDTILFVTDVLLENTAGDSGTVTIRRNDQILLSVGLETFRNLDYHFVAPLVFPAGNLLEFRVECTNPPPNTGRCRPAVSLVGFRRTIPPPP